MSNHRCANRRDYTSTNCDPSEITVELEDRLKHNAHYKSGQGAIEERDDKIFHLSILSVGAHDKLPVRSVSRITSESTEFRSARC